MEIKEEEFKIISVWARSEHREGWCFVFCQPLACFGFGDGHRGTLQHRPGGPIKRADEFPRIRLVNSTIGAAPSGKEFKFSSVACPLLNDLRQVLQGPAEYEDVREEEEEGEDGAGQDLLKH